MSVGQDVERSMLERKERADLVTMAVALGEKPPPRAKKAEIVDLILRLTNVSEREPAESTTAASTAADPAEGAEPIAAAGPQSTNRSDASPDRPGSAADPGPAPAGSVASDDDSDGDEETGGSGHLAATADADASDPAGRMSDDGTGTDQANGRSAPGTSSASSRSPDRESARAGRSEPSSGRADDPNRVVPSASSRPDHDARDEGNDLTSSASTNGDADRPAGVGNERSQEGRQQSSTPPQHAQQDRQGQENQQGQSGQQGQRPDDGEPGNRRRRRRGRDRERGGPAVADEAFLEDPIDVEGLLDLREEGYGFLRLKGFLPSKDDVYVSVKQVRQFGLRKGDKLDGKSRPASRNEKNPALLQIDAVNGAAPEKARERARFEDLTPLFPDEKLRLEMTDDPTNMTARIVDLIAPIGKGQRGLIVSPPKAGKTTVMKQIARSLEVNNPEVHLIVLLVDERPEEVTDMRRWLLRGEVAASTFDRPSEEHTTLAELVIERAKRLVEDGKDVVIILDGITRLARAYNLSAPASGRIMSGGIDAAALYPPKKFFGAARNVEEGGSLTILATALVETNSRMDDHIFEEFKGTGNMELKLDRKLADRRIYPAIDVDASSTRREELLFERRQLQQVWKLRRVLSGLSGEGASGAAGLELLIDRMKTFKNNEEFLSQVAKAPTVT